MVNSLSSSKAINKQQLKAFEQAKKTLINKNYNEIYAHEAAHKSVAGDLGGSIHIVKNSAGIPISGFVPIKIPGIPTTKQPSLLEKTINQAKTVIKAAMAPKDPSSADYAVKAGAEKTLYKAKELKTQGNTANKHVDYIA